MIQLVKNVLKTLLLKQKLNKFKAQPILVDGIQFKSGLEAFTYKAIIQIGLFPQYEVQKFKLFQGFPSKGVQAYLPSKKTKHQR